jgi:hypothetical protein
MTIRKNFEQVVRLPAGLAQNPSKFRVLKSFLLSSSKRIRRPAHNDLFLRLVEITGVLLLIGVALPLGAQQGNQSIPGPASGGTGNGSSVITAGQLLVTYGAKFNVSVVPDGSTTSSSNVVTCPSDCKFLTGLYPAQVGMVFFANQGSGSSCLDNVPVTFGGIPQTSILSVDSDTQIHVVGNANATTTATACMAWGTDDTTALNNAFAAGGCGVSLFLPGGKTFVSAPVFQQIAGCPSVAIAGTGYIGPRLFGSGVTNTYFIPVPNFQPSGCPSPGTSNGCFFSANISDIENVQIWGLGTRCTATAAVDLAFIGIATRAVNFSGEGWCARGGGNNNIGVAINGATDVFSVGGSIFFGSVGVQVVAAPVTVNNNSFTCNGFSVNGTSCVVITSASSVTSFANTVSGGVVEVAGVLSSSNDIIGGSATDSCLKIDASPAVVNLVANNKVCFPSPGAGISPVFFNGSGGVLNIGMNNSLAGSSSTSVFTGTAGSIINEGGMNNTYTNGGGGIWNGTGSWFGDGNVTGVAQTSGNIGLTSGWGTSTVGTVSGNTKYERWIITGAGTPAANPVLTVTFPKPFVAVPVCVYSQEGGTFGVITNPAITTTATTATLTFAGTPVAAQTYTMVLQCSSQ